MSTDPHTDLTALRLEPATVLAALVLIALGLLGLFEISIRVGRGRG